jgi:transketolase
VTHQARTNQQVSIIKKAGYIFSDNSNEVGLATNFTTKPPESGHNVPVVSIPYTNIFDTQSSEYQNLVLPSNIGNAINI